MAKPKKPLRGVPRPMTMEEWEKSPKDKKLDRAALKKHNAKSRGKK